MSIWTYFVTGEITNIQGELEHCFDGVMSTTTPPYRVGFYREFQTEFLAQNFPDFELPSLVFTQMFLLDKTDGDHVE